MGLFKELKNLFSEPGRNRNGLVLVDDANNRELPCQIAHRKARVAEIRGAAASWLECEPNGIQLIRGNIVLDPELDFYTLKLLKIGFQERIRVQRIGEGIRWNIGNGGNVTYSGIEPIILDKPTDTNDTVPVIECIFLDEATDRSGIALVPLNTTVNDIWNRAAAYCSCEPTEINLTFEAQTKVSRRRVPTEYFHGQELRVMFERGVKAIINIHYVGDNISQNIGQPSRGYNRNYTGHGVEQDTDNSSEEDFGEDFVTCSTCIDTYPESQNVQRITRACSHARTTCASCLKRWITTQMESGRLSNIQCPECPAELEYNDLIRHTPENALSKYERLSTRAVLGRIPDFMYCLNPEGCESGQIHEGGTEQPIFTCIVCNYRYCTQCSKPWHQDESCEQYQRRIRARSGDEEASRRLVEQTSKPCPRCKVNIEKIEGCDHMTCGLCKHQFCWICMADFEPILRTGSCEYHSVDCKWYIPPYRPGVRTLSD